MARKMTIPGDELLALRIAEAAQAGALSHAVIISGSGDLEAAARYTAAAMQCSAGERPCGECAACSKIMRDIHPDVRFVVDEEHKNISVDILREIRADAYILPNEGRRKIYIFPDCGKLEPRAQNVMLKVLEEGPPHAAFLFCAANSAVLLQTIRSRAVEYKLSPAVREGEVSGEAQRLCSLIAEKNAAELAAFCTELENSKIAREELQNMLSDARDIFAAALAASYGAAPHMPGAQRIAREMNRRALTTVIDVLQRYSQDCGYNVGIGHLAGALSVSLEP